MTKFQDFSRPEHYDVLARGFEDNQDLVHQVAAETRLQRQRWENWRDYNDLVQKYSELYGKMMRSLFNSKGHSDIDKVRKYYSLKLGPLLKKLEEAERKVSTNVLTDNASNVYDIAAAPAAVARAPMDGGAKEAVRDIEHVASEVKNMSERLADPNIPPDKATIEGMLNKAKDLIEKVKQAGPTLAPNEVLKPT